MRTKLVVGNWKMNFTQAEATAAVEIFLRHVEARTDVDVALCPSYLSLPRVRELVRDSHVKVGAQDVFWMDQGAFTGNVSAKMLYDFCVSYCIVGHSETRGRFGKLEIPDSTLGYFSESDETINLKLKALIYHSISPILCVGETLAEREAGQTDAVIQSQLKRAITGIEAAELYLFSVAYEPVWAIGTGKTCDTLEANRVCGMIRRNVAELLDSDVAEEIRILYGGSVKSSNSGELFAQPEIDGGLVGGASLDPLEFSRIVMSA
ncbi:MAG TPA: triose-phosphate isomerase [Fimbriimonadaceae bacterium]|nr:triose-phosphate isomerase [Fimbriimonadaceae bacterium]